MKPRKVKVCKRKQIITRCCKEKCRNDRFMPWYLCRDHLWAWATKYLPIQELRKWKVFLKVTEDQVLREAL